MKTYRFLYIIATMLFLASGFLLAIAHAAAEDKPTYRELTHKYFEDGKGKALSKIVGFETPVRNALALEYKVLLYSKDQNGRPIEKTVDPKEYQFQIGDRIRLVVKPLEDYYIYLFHISVSGQHDFLVPAEDQEPIKADKNVPLVLPKDGFLEFTSPAGTERLRLVASKEPVPNLAMLARVLRKKPGEPLKKEENQLKKTLKPTRQSVSSSPQEQTKQLLEKTVLWRGLMQGEKYEKLLKDICTREVKYGTFEEPGSNGQATLVVYLSTKRKVNARLLVNIPLRSIEPKPEKPEAATAQ